jgi:hypothetical protein
MIYSTISATAHFSYNKGSISCHIIIKKKSKIFSPFFSDIKIRVGTLIENNI